MAESNILNVLKIEGLGIRIVFRAMKHIMVILIISETINGPYSWLFFIFAELFTLGCVHVKKAYGLGSFLCELIVLSSSLDFPSSMVSWRLHH